MPTTPQPSVAAIVLAYHPDDDIVRNAQALRAQVARVYVVNNSPDPGSQSLLDRLAEDLGFTILDQEAT